MIRTSFTTKEEAIAARKAAEEEHFGPYAPKDWKLIHGND